MKTETTKHLITWFLLIFTIFLVAGTAYEMKTCKDHFILGEFWWECVKDLE